MKQFSKKLAWILVFAQVFCLFSAVAGADYGVPTEVKVGSFTLLDEVYYMEQGGTLVDFSPYSAEEADHYIRFVSGQEPVVTMKNFSFTLWEESADPTYSALYVPMDVELNIIGSNSLVNNGAYLEAVGDGTVFQRTSNGINATWDRNIRLTGDGTLSVKTSTGEDVSGYAFLANRVSFESNTLTVEAEGATAAYSSAPLHNDDLKLNVEAGNDAWSKWEASSEDGASFTQYKYVITAVTQNGPTAEEIAAAEEAERQRLAEEEAERQRLAEEEAERQRLAEEEAERQRLAEEEAERQRLAEEEAERQRLAEEEAERQRQQEEEAARQAELQRQQEEEAARQAELQRQQEEEAARQAELQRQQEEEARVAAEQAMAEETARLEAEAAAAAQQTAPTGMQVLLSNQPVEEGAYYIVSDGALVKVDSQPESGFISFSGNTVTMNNFHFTASQASDSDRYAALYLSEDATLVITGENDLTNVGYYIATAEDGSPRYISNGIAAPDCALTVTGQGTLNVNGITAEGYSGYGISAGIVTVANGVTLNVQGREGQSLGEITYEPAPEMQNPEVVAPVTQNTENPEDEAAKKAAEEEAAKKAAEEEAAKKAAEEEAAKKAAEEEAAKKAAEEEAAKKAAEEEAAKKAAEEEAAKKAAEEEAAKKAAEEKAARIAAEEAAKKAAEEEAARIEAEKKAEEERLAEAARLAEAEEAKKAEEAAALKAAEEEAAEKARIAEEAAKEEKPEVTAMTVDMQQVENDVAKEDENLDAVLAENFTAVKTPSLMTVNPGMTIEESLPGPTLSVPEQVKSSAPAVTFSPTGDSSGILSTTDSNVKFQVGIKKDGSYAGPRMWMDLDGNMGIDNLTENSVIQVKRVVEGEKESDIVQFALERQPQLTATSSPATSESNNDGKIILPAGTGPVEIRVSDGDGVYKDAIVNSSNEITGLTGGKTYQLRIKADGVKLASLPIDVTVGTYSAPTKLEKPAAAFTATGEQSGILKNVDSSMVYRVGSGSWTAITGETATISSGVSGQIYVKRVGSSSANTLDSDEQVIQIQQYSAPEKEKLPVSGGTITVQYVPQAQYKAHSAPESSYVDVTNRVIQNLSQGDYDIRIKYDGAILASKPVTVTIANVPVTGISMDPKEVKLSSTDSSAKLTVTFSPLNASNQTVSWYSSNENVVRIQNSYKVSDGVAGASVVAVGQGTATIYAISNGKQATCTVTVQTNYYFTYHKNGTWYYDVGGNYTVQATGPANRLAAVKLNGQTINPYYYTVATASDGSTIVTISETAMRAMEHRAYQTLQFVYSDGGTATCYLHILSVRDKPITGDDSNIGLWVCVMLMSSAMGGALLSRRKEWE